MKKILFALLILVSVCANAQQDAIYSQYMFNPFAINPAYAGSRDAMSGVLLIREQWRGIEGAPSTQTFSFHASKKSHKSLHAFSYFKVAPLRATSKVGTTVIKKQKSYVC